MCEKAFLSIFFVPWRAKSEFPHIRIIMGAKEITAPMHSVLYDAVDIGERAR